MKIAIIGDTCTDEFVYGKTRMSPEAPTPVFKAINRVKGRGMAGNVAQNVKAMIAPTDEVVLFTHSEEIIKRRFVDKASNYIIMREDIEPFVMPMQLNKDNEALGEALDSWDIVIISDYDKGFLTRDIIADIARRSKLTFLDTKKPLGDWCQDVDFIKINEIEYENPAHQEDGLLLSLRDKLIVTLGDRGAMYKDQVYPVEKVEVRDVVGAGDTFLAAFAVAYYKFRRGWYVDLTHEYSVEKAMEFANKCSAQVVQQAGVAIPDMKKIKMESPYEEK